MDQDFSVCRKIFFEKKITFLLIALVILIGSIFIVDQRLVLRKSAEGDVSGSISTCRLIPSSLYGAPEEEWSKYECIDGVAKLKTVVATSAEKPADESLVENLQVPSIKSFASSVQTGDATVNYPIEVPPAAGSFVPSISLNYSSSAVGDIRFNSTDAQWQNGWSWSQGSYTGLGWNLSGIPQIFQNSAGRYYLVVDGRSSELEGPDGFNNQSASVADDLVYTTKPNSHLKIIRKYKNPDVSYPSTGTSLGNAAADYRSWDVWTKDGKHYRFEPLGFIPKQINCSISTLERNWDYPHSDGNCDCGDKGGSDSCQNILRKRDFNKWVLTEASDTSNNKIVYEYNPPVNWENALATGGYDNVPDVCRDKCNKNEEGYKIDPKNWENCSKSCFSDRNAGQNLSPIELSYQDSGFSDLTFYQSRVLYPRAIYPVAIKYGVGLKTGNEDKTNKIEFLYSKRDDNNYGWNRSSGDRKLDEINIKLGNNLIRSYKLEYEYSQSGRDNPWDSYLGDSSVKKGQLLLQSVKLKGTAGEPFPVFQTYEYYPFTDVVKGLLLKKANNGYGASVEYDYNRDTIGVYWEHSSDGSAPPGDGVPDGGDAIRHNRTRLISKISRSSSSSQAQKTEYSYLADNSGSFCGDNTSASDCHTNSHATLHVYSGDFEFLGWSRVKETVSSSEDGSSWIPRMATYYNYNPGGLDNKNGNSWVFNTREQPAEYYKKGTLARKTVVKFENGNEIAVSADNMSYATTNVADSAYNNLFFTSESKSCGDLDVGDSSLRRGGYSNLPINETDIGSIDDYFDKYGNSIKQNEYVVNSCSVVFANNSYYPEVDVSNNKHYRTAVSSYAYLVNDASYIVDKPIGKQVNSANGDFLQGTWFFYDGTEDNISGVDNPHTIGPKNRGLVTANVVLEADKNKIKKDFGGEITTINTKTVYNENGNPIKSIAYSDYGSFAKMKDAWIFRLARWPSEKKETTTTYDNSHFQAFPKTTKTEPAPYVTTTTITYDFEIGTAPVLGLPVSSIDPNGLVTKTAYDSFGRIVKKVNPGDTDISPTVKYYYTDRVGSPNNPAMIVESAKKNNAIADDASDSVGRLRSYAFYNDLGQKLQTQSQSTEPAKMFADETKYDSLGRPFKQIAQMERTGTLGTYLNLNADAEGEFVTKTTYDTQGRAIRIVNPDNTCSVTKYEGKKTYVIDPNRNLSSVETDKYEDRSGELRNIKTAFAYEAGSVGSVLGESTSNSNIFLKLIKYISTATKGALSPTSDLCSRETVNYPFINEKIYTKQETETNVLGQTVVASVIDPSKVPPDNKIISQTTSAYDGFGRVMETFDPDLGINKILSYNALGQALKTQDNRGTIRSTVYDDLGRVIKTYEGDCYGTTLNCTPSTAIILKSQLTYDLPAYGTALGKLVEEKTPGIISKEYFYQGGLGGGQNIGLLSKTKQSGNPGLTEELTYDAAGRVKTISYTPGKGTVNEWQIKETLTNQYDQIGRLISIASNLRPDWTEGNYPIITNISYNPFGLPVEKKYSNDIIESFVYDEANKTLRLKEHTVSRNGNSYLSLNYLNYDNVGNIKELKDNKLNETTSIKYDYDNFYRLTGVSGPYTASYDYDKLGRMIKKNEKENLTYHFDDFTGTGTAKLQDYYPLNAPKIINDTTKLEYKDGNLTQTLAGLNLTYDGLNRLIKTENADSVTKYTYDFSGQRSSKTESFANGQTATYYSGSTEFIKKLVLNSGAALPVTDVTETVGVTPAATGTITETYKRYYPFGGLRTITRTRGAGALSDEKNFYYIFTDHLSSTKAIIDQNGAVSSTGLDYYPYGNIRVGESAPAK